MSLRGSVGIARNGPRAGCCHSAVIITTPARPLKWASPVTSSPPAFRAHARTRASTVCSRCRIFKSAASSATASSTAAIDVRSLMNARRSAGSRPSDMYFAFSSVRQTAGVKRTSSPSTIARTACPARDPRKYSTHAHESKVFMRVLLVPQALWSEPRVRPEHRSLSGEEGLRQDLVNRVRDPAGADLPDQVRPDILAEQDCRLDAHCEKTYTCTYT